MGEATSDYLIFSSSSMRETRTQLLTEATSKHSLHGGSVIGVVRIEGGKAVGQRRIQQPFVVPERCMGAIANLNFRQSTIPRQLCRDQFGEVGIRLTTEVGTMV